MNLCIRSGGRMIQQDQSPPGSSRSPKKISAILESEALAPSRPHVFVLSSIFNVFYHSKTYAQNSLFAIVVVLLTFLDIGLLISETSLAQISRSSQSNHNFSASLSDAETVDINFNDPSLAKAFDFFPDNELNNQLETNIPPIPLSKEELQEEIESAEKLAHRLKQAFFVKSEEEAEASDEEIREMYRELLESDVSLKSGPNQIAISKLSIEDFVEIHRLYLKGQRLSFLHRSQIEERLIKSGQNPDSPEFAEAVEDLMLKDMLANNIHTSDESLAGKVELNAVADHGKYHYFIRVVHYPSSLSITFPDASSFVERLNHFKKYIGRQFFVANRSVLNIPMDNHKPVGMQYYPIPDNWKGGYPTLRSMFSSYYWSNYFRAIWKSADYPVDGATATLMLAAEVLIMLPVDLSLGNTGIAQYMTKTIFGLGIGTHARVIKNWQQMKGRLTPDGLDKVSSTLKQMMISVPFGAALAAGMVFTSQGGNFAETAEVIQANFLSMSGSILANAVISGFFKDEVMQIIRSLSQARLLQNMTDLEASNKTIHQRFWGNFKGDNGIGQGVRVFTGLVRYVDIILTNPAVADNFGGPLVVNTISKLAFGSLSIIPMHLNALIFYRLNRAAKNKHAQNPEAMDLKAKYLKINKTYSNTLKRLSTFYKSFYKIPLAIYSLIRHPIQTFKDLSKPTSEQLEEERLALAFRKTREILNSTNFEKVTTPIQDHSSNPNFTDPSFSNRTTTKETPSRSPTNPDSFLSNFQTDLPTGKEADLNSPLPETNNRVNKTVHPDLHPPFSTGNDCGDTFKQ